MLPTFEFHLQLRAIAPDQHRVSAKRWAELWPVIIR